MADDVTPISGTIGNNTWCADGEMMPGGVTDTSGCGLVTVVEYGCVVRSNGDDAAGMIVVTTGNSLSMRMTTVSVGCVTGGSAGGKSAGETNLPGELKLDSAA